MRPKLRRKVRRSQSLWALSLFSPFLPIPSYPLLLLTPATQARRYRAHIATVYFISMPPVSQNPPGPPLVMVINAVQEHSILGDGCLLPNKHTKQTLTLVKNN